jgi:hypothetical protein
MSNSTLPLGFISIATIILLNGGRFFYYTFIYLGRVNSIESFTRVAVMKFTSFKIKVPVLPII